MSEQSHEFSAKSVETAIEDGLRQLGVDRDRVDVEVLHEGSRGLLGIGSTNAQVRLTLLPDPATSAPAPAPAVQPDAQEMGQDEDTGEETYGQTDSQTDEPTDEEADEETADQPPAGSVEDTGEDGDDSSGDSSTDSSTDSEDEASDEPEMDGDDVVALAEDILLEMVSLMGLDAQIESSQRQEPDESDAAIYLNLTGDDLGVLIGRHGETIASMQYLLRLMVNQKLRRWTNIVVDVEGYKDRRAEKLAQMALRMADQVVETGRSVALEPMPANERRLVHIALRDHAEVYTESTGEDTRRKIQILLK